MSENGYTWETVFGFCKAATATSRRTYRNGNTYMIDRPDDDERIMVFKNMKPMLKERVTVQAAGEFLFNHIWTAAKL